MIGKLPGRHYRVVLALCLLGAVTLFYLALADAGLIQALQDGAVLRHEIARAGTLGPVLVVTLMAIAIVFNPIPSAPIALAAGAAYGHTFGTIYIVIGAEIGAIVAFTIARLAGHDVLCRWFGKQVSLNWLGSQNVLTFLVLVSRLIPFISFDLVSYGAGLTPIRPWRFALATLIGIIPASFLLAHFGGELATADLNKAMIFVLLIGVVVLIPLLTRFIHSRQV